jgi:CRP-like cAMP-binding protein
LSGNVAVRKFDIAGKTTSIAVVGAGDILGEMSLIDGEHRFASCVTVEPTRFAVLSRMDLTEITALHPRLANKFLFMMLQIMVSRLRDTGMRMVTETNSPAV